MSDILTGFNMQGNDPIDDRIVSKSILETLEEYLKRVPVQKRYYGLTFFALDKDNKLRQYTFQTSLIEPTIDDSDDRLDKLQENIDNVDKDLQDHKNDKSIHKTSEEIRSEIVDADIPDSIARAQWVIQSIGVAIENIIAGASTDYDTLKKVQTKIEDLRSEMESQLYGDDGSGIFKTLEQVLDFLNEYKDFIIDIPNNFVSKHDIIDNLTTDDAAKVLSARQGKILSETLTNYFDSAMQSIRSETDRATNAENRIEAKLDDEITRSTNKDENHDSRLNTLEGKSHTQNTDLGTTNSAFQLKYNTGNKIKHESDAISVRNSADTDYVNFIAKNATFKGDLLVEGKSFVTEAETVEIKDNLLLLNKGEVGSGVTKGIAGLEIDRGTEPNYQIVFDESDNRFKAGEIGDIQCLALRDGDDSMKDGMFTSWDSTTKRLKTTNIVPETTPLLFGNSNLKQNSEAHVFKGSNLYAFKFSNASGSMWNVSGEMNWNFDTNKQAFCFWKPLVGITFKRESDLSEVLYHADLVNNLTTGGTNKPLTAEQGKVLKTSIDGINTEISSIRNSYLPLSGGTMTGNIVFTNGLGISGIGSDGNSRNLIGSVKNSNRVSVGNTASPLTISSGDVTLIHARGSKSYDIYDAYNLPDPAKLSADQTFTGTNNFTAGKFNVTGDKSKFSVNGVGGLRIYYDYADDEAGISRYLDFYTKTSSDTDYTRRGIFGLYASKSTPNSDYAYIGAGDVGSEDAQYRFYHNTLYIPETFYLRTSSLKRQLIGVDNINNRARFGGPSIPTWIISNNTDLFHSKYTNQSTHSEYKIWDESNLPSPASTTDLSKYALLAGDNTFTGSNTFNKTVNIARKNGTISLNPIDSIKYVYPTNEVSRALVFIFGTDSDKSFEFGGYYSQNNNIKQAYIALPGKTYDNAEYRFRDGAFIVPNVFDIITANGTLLLRRDGDGVQFGSNDFNNFLLSNNTDLTHRKYTASSTYTDYKIWDASNLPNPVQTSDLADYATKQWVTDNFSGGGSGSDLLPANNTWSGTNTYTKNVVLANNIKLISSKVDGTSVNLIQEDSSNNLIVGNGSPVRIYGGGNLTHYIGSSAYTIYDTSNLPNPVQTSDLESYATKTWVGEQGYLTNSSLSGYATQQWVKDQEYITGADIPPIVIANSGSGNAVTSITATGHALTVTKGATYLTQSSLAGYATEAWVTNKGYLTSSSLDGYAKTTDLASYLPLAGGTMTGAINFSSSQILTLENKPLVAYDSTSNYVNIGSYSLNSRLFFLTSQTDLQHYRKNDGELAGTSYKIWDAYNVSSPLDYMKGTAGQVASVSGKEISINGVNQTHIVLGLGGNGITLFAPTTAGTSGQVLQSQGAGKAPIWVDGGTGGGVQLSDTNVWTGLNTFQGGLKTSDGTNSYDVWDNNSLKYPVKYAINSTGTGYALSFYSKTAGWKEIDTLTTKYLTSATVKSISSGGDGYIGIESNAYASAAISKINTNSIYFRGLNSTVLSTNDDGELEYGSSSNYARFNSGNIRIAYSFVSSSGGGGGGGGTTDPSEGGLTISYYPVNQKNNVTERAKIYCTTTNLYLKDLAKNTQLDFDTDGLYVTTGSTSRVRLATLNDISGSGGGGVSLSGNNTWTGTNTFNKPVVARNISPGDNYSMQDGGRGSLGTESDCYNKIYSKNISTDLIFGGTNASYLKLTNMGFEYSAASNGLVFQFLMEADGLYIQIINPDSGDLTKYKVDMTVVS